MNRCNTIGYYQCIIVIVPSVINLQANLVDHVEHVLLLIRLRRGRFGPSPDRLAWSGDQLSTQLTL